MKYSKDQDRRSSSALLIIDMINDLEFDEGERLLEFASQAATNLKKLKCRFHSAQLPIIYANDNFGKWQSNFHSLVDHCVQPGIRGREIAEQLRPDVDDYFILKPKHSAFYSTPLDLLLKHLSVDTLIITGVATDICVQFTSNDAYMRDYRLIIPHDCVAANSKMRSDGALGSVQKVLKADISASTELDLASLSQSCCKSIP